MGILPFLLTVYLYSMDVVQLPMALMFFCSALALLSMFMGFTLLRQSSNQMTDLATHTMIADFDDPPDLQELQVDDELKDIACNFNSVVEQLHRAKRDVQSRSYQLQEFASDLSASYEHLENESRLRERLSRYVGKELVEKLMTSADSNLLRNERKNVTILFADIRSFTSISQHMDPEDVVAMLNEFFSVMMDIIFKYNGMLDKFVGDQVMAVFGHRSSERNGARSAVRAAMEMQQATVSLMRARARKGQPVFQVGIGINTGSAILASVGASNRQDYTVIGDTVNTTARLEKHALGREIVIGESTRKHLPAKMHLSTRKELSMKGRPIPLVCYVHHPTGSRAVNRAIDEKRVHSFVPSAAGC